LILETFVPYWIDGAGVEIGDASNEDGVKTTEGTAMSEDPNVCDGEVVVEVVPASAVED
jgi:hypothetical protein